MYVVFGIERHGHVITEIFLKNKKNIMDRVMYVANIHDVVKIEVKEIIIDENGIKDLYVQRDGYNFENSFDIFFLTREEAEQALKEIKDVKQ